MSAFTLTSSIINNNPNMTFKGDFGIVLSLNDTLEIGDTLTLECDNNYIFEDTPYYNYSENFVSKKAYFTLSNGDATAKLYITRNYTYNSMVAETVLQVQPTGYLLTESNATKLTGLSVYNDLVLLEVGDSVPQGGVMRLVCDSEVVFDGEVYIEYSIDFEPFRVDFVINEDLTEAVATLPNVDLTNYNINFTLEYIANVVSGTNLVYEVTEEQLKEVNSQRFGFEVIGEEQIDYGVYILSLIKLPFKLSPDLIGGDSLVKLGNKETTVLAKAVLTDNIPLDLGSVAIPELNNNVLDFKGVEAYLYLPRVEPVLIELDQIIGETVSIQYLIDCYSGVATVNLSTTKNGGKVFKSLSVDIGINIPYALTTLTNTILDNSSIDVGGENGIRTPFLEIRKKDLVLPDGFFTVPILEENVLTGQTGFIKIEDIDLKSSAAKDNKETIISLLENGVIIND